MSFFTLRTLLFVAEILAASLLLPLLAFAATRLMRRAALRHLVWLTMFGVLALLPLAALLLPARQIVLTDPAPAIALAPVANIALPPAETVEPLPEMWEGKRSPTLALETPALALKMDFSSKLAPAETAPAPAMPVPVLSTPREPLLTARNSLLVLALLWIAGFVWHLGRMTLGGIGLMRLRRKSQAFSLPGAPCELRLSPDVSGPSTCGLFRPVVLLPPAAQDWSPARLEAVLRHEAAHVARRDALNQFVVRLVCAAYWFNPLLWLAARALRREAELAADDAALASGLTPSSYAAELVALAAEARGPQPGIAMAESALAARVEAALAANISRKGVSTMDVTRMLSLGLAGTLLLATARVDLALAQDKPANPVPAARPAPAAQAAPAARPAPPARSAGPKVGSEGASRIERDREALSAAAAAMQAQKARMAATAEEMKEQARQMAVTSAEMKSQAAKMAAAAADMKLPSGEMAAALRQRMAQAAQNAKLARQQALEAQQRAREAEVRALEAKAQAEEARRRMREAEQKESRVLSDEEVLALARQQKVTVSPFEVNERLRTAQGNVTDAQRKRAVVELARETLEARLWEDVVNNQPYGALGRTAEERDLFDAARKVPVVMSNLEVDARVYQQLIRSNNLAPSTEVLSELKRRTLTNMTREKLALQGGATTQTGSSQDKQGDYFGAPYYSRSNGVNLGGEILVPVVSHRDLKERAGLLAMIQTNLDEAARKIDAMVSTAGNLPRNLYTTRWFYSGNDVTVAMQVAAPVSGLGSPDADAKVKAIIDAAMKEMTGKIAAAAAEAKAAPKP